MNTIRVMRTLKALIFCAALICGSTFHSLADANPPQLMSYQGYVEDSDGNPVASTATNYEVIFRIYENETKTDGEKSLWSESQIVTFDNGVFSVMLGAGSAKDFEPHEDLSEVFNNGIPGTDSEDSTVSERYIGITILNLPSGNDSELSPRLKLLSAPFAYLANKALVADKLSNSNFALDENGNLSLNEKLTVTGSSKFGDLEAGVISASSVSSSGAISGTSISTSTGATIGGDITAVNINASGYVTSTGSLTANSQSYIYSTNEIDGESDWKGALFLGSGTGLGLGLDSDSIQSVSYSSGSGVKSALNINPFGGQLNLGSTSSKVLVKHDLEVDGTSTFDGNAEFKGTETGFQNGIIIRASVPSISSSNISNINVPILNSIQMRASGHRWVIGAEDQTTDEDLHFLFNANNSDSGYQSAIYIDPSGAITKSSDRSLKKNIETVDLGILDKLMGLRPVYYHRTYQEDEEKKQLGFIAQEVEDVFPDLPEKSKGLYGLNYDNFGVLAVSAIQELRKEKDQEIDHLESENSSLKQENDALKERLLQLELRFEKLEKLIK